MPPATPCTVYAQIYYPYLVFRSKTWKHSESVQCRSTCIFSFTNLHSFSKLRRIIVQIAKLKKIGVIKKQFQYMYRWLFHQKQVLKHHNI